MIHCRNALFLFSLIVSLASCDPATDSVPVNSDERIRSQVEAALNAAADLPSTLTVEVSNGRVSITGSLQCDDCGGFDTPGNIGTVQQSLGAIVRAVPGVTEVEFILGQ